MPKRAEKVGGGRVAVPMTLWLAPAVEVDGPGNRRVPVEWNAAGTRLDSFAGEVGDGAAVVVRYAKGDYDAAANLAHRIRAAGYTNVRAVRAGR